jgi:sugar lactone lactonase YvrE
MRTPAPIEPARPMHLAIPTDAADASARHRFAVAHPTGRVVFIGEDDAGVRRLYIRAIDEPETRLVAGTDHAEGVIVSPDGRTVLFTWNDPDSTREELRRISIDGGPVTTLLATDSGPGFSLDYLPVWLSPTSVLVSGGDRQSLYELSLETLGTALLTNVADVVEGAAFAIPWSVLPDGRTVLLSCGIPDEARGPVLDMFAVDLRDPGASRVLMGAAGGVVFDGGRRIAFIRDGALCVARFDPTTNSVVGEFTPLFSPVTDFEIGADGSLYYTLGVEDTEGVRPIAVGLDGSREPLTERRLFLRESVHLSPDGGAIGVTTAPNPGGAPLAEILDIRTGFMSPVVRPAPGRPLVTAAPLWIDANTVVYGDYRSSRWFELHRLRPNDEVVGTPIVPLGEDGGVQANPAFSPDGRWMVYRLSPVNDAPVRSLWIVPLEGDGEVRPLVQSGGVDDAPAFSPDGEWLAYSSDSAGEYRVVMQRFDTETGTVSPRIIPVSQGQGGNPVWSRDGEYLYYIDPQERSLKRVAVEHEPTLRLSAPEVSLTAAQLDGLTLMTARPFDIFPDGDRFVFVESLPDDGRDRPYINVTLNWLTELQSLMPVE